MLIYYGYSYWKIKEFTVTPMILYLTWQIYNRSLISCNFWNNQITKTRDFKGILNHERCNGYYKNLQTQQKSSDIFLEVFNIYSNNLKIFNQSKIIWPFKFYKSSLLVLSALLIPNNKKEKSEPFNPVFSLATHNFLGSFSFTVVLFSNLKFR